MIASIFIQPHERDEALNAYKDKLTLEQIAQIEDAPESAIINLQCNLGSPGTKITIIEEG